MLRFLKFIGQTPQRLSHLLDYPIPPRMEAGPSTVITGNAPDRTAKRENDLEGEVQTGLGASAGYAKRVKMEREGEGEDDEVVGAEAKKGLEGASRVSKTGRKGRKGEKEGRKEWVGRRRGTRPEGEDGTVKAEDNLTDDGKEKEARLPKRRCALLIGFCGSGYRGMQMSVHLFSVGQI